MLAPPVCSRDHEPRPVRSRCPRRVSKPCLHPRHSSQRQSNVQNGYKYAPGGTMRISEGSKLADLFGVRTFSCCVMN